jgi:hypothetical protein
MTQGKTLHLNIDASHGQATVQVCGNQGHTVERWKVSKPSTPIRGDHLNVRVEWPDTDFSEMLKEDYARAITFRIQLRNADLYSLWME